MVVSTTAGAGRSARAGATARSYSTITSEDPGHPATPDGIRSVKVTDVMPLGAVWTPEEEAQPFDPAVADEPAG